MAGQTFQERSASFEHMYAPSRAKALFSKHCALKDLLDRDLKRMRWEWKTSDTELSKEIQLFHKRSGVLQRKVKDIEDKYFASLAEEDEDGCTEEPGPRPATCPGLKRSRSDVSQLRKRPQTSHAAQAPPVELRERPHSSLSHHSSAHAASSRPNSALLSQRKVQHTVRFAPTARTTESAPVVQSVYDLDHGATAATDRRSQLRQRRERAVSGFALTKAKRYELRNQRFYDDNEKYKEYIRGKIDNYLDRVDQYKEEYRTMLETERKVPPITEADVTAVDDVSGDSTMANKFQVKLRNPFGMAAAFQRPPEDKQTDDKQVESGANQTSQASIDSNKSDAQNETRNEVAPLTAQNLAKLQLAKAESNYVRGDPEQASTNTRPSTQKTLRIRRQLSGLSGDEAVRERARLLYHEAHSDGKLLSATQRNIVLEPTEKKEPPTQSKLRVDQRRLRDAFNDFLESSRSVDEMHKMVAEAAKMKAKTKKARDMSIVPFMSARKAARTWKELVAQSRAAHAEHGGAPTTT